ncbi:DUF1499 domain-containing protein [Halobacteriovorax sp. XZX-3]|uniref:DUF1499 domain-containing protein n=1 Tax=unclassified Halobacteriovorax TaxID=2639665 RepID=UPI0037169F3D
MKRLARLSVIIAVLLTTASCSKEFLIQESSSLDNFTCPSIDNCLSSKEKKASSSYIMPFKMLGATPEENIEKIASVIRKIGGYQIERNEVYLKATNEEVQLEFIFNEAAKQIEVRSQVLKQSFFSYNQGRKDIEAVRFNFFQGNF